MVGEWLVNQWQHLDLMVGQMGTSWNILHKGRLLVNGCFTMTNGNGCLNALLIVMAVTNEWLLSGSNLRGDISLLG